MIKPCRRVTTLLFAALAASVLFAGCESPPPPAPDADAVAWTDYEDAEVGFSFRHPEVYVTDVYAARPGGVLLRHDGYPVLSVSHLTRPAGSLLRWMPCAGLRGSHPSSTAHRKTDEIDAKYKLCQ